MPTHCQSFPGYIPNVAKTLCEKCPAGYSCYTTYRSDLVACGAGHYSLLGEQVSHLTTFIPRPLIPRPPIPRPIIPRPIPRPIIPRPPIPRPIIPRPPIPRPNVPLSHVSSSQVPHATSPRFNVTSIPFILKTN